MKRKFLLLLASAAISSPGFAQIINSEDFIGSDSDAGNLRQYIVKEEPAKKLEIKGFNPTLNMGIGFQLISVLSQANKTEGPGSSSMNFQPADFKIGFLHADAAITDNLSAGFSLNMHTSAANKVSDMFIKYTPWKTLGFQIGRFKGAGNRAAFMTSAYDLDLADFTYIAETQGIDIGAPDLRFYGIDLFGQYKWVKYSFLWHKSHKDRTRYWSQVSNTEVPANGGINLKSWSLALGFTPIKFVEFGGHAGSVNRPGMGDRTRAALSSYLYYEQPKKFKVKLDYVFHYRPVFEDGTPAQDDYTQHDWHAEKKQGISVLAGGFVNKHIEPVARFEHFYEGKNAAIGYEAMNLYTVGFNYYPFPDSPRVGKITAFYQKRDERNGIKLRNDWFGVQYQMVLFGKIFGN